MNTFQVDAEKRTIYGLAVPYGEPTHSDGAKFQFSRGVVSLPDDPSRIKLLVGHDRQRAVGKATELTDSDEGLWARFSIARGAAGDEALSMAEDGVWDGLSIGLRDGAKFSKQGNVTHFSRAVLSEISLTPDPAFSTARVAAVVMHAPEGNTSMTDTTEETPVAPIAFDMDAFAKALAEHMPAPTTTVVNPTAEFEVNEPSPYAFDAEHSCFIAGQGEHDFSTDLITGLKRGEGSEEYQRALGFVQTQFAVVSGNATSANYPTNRPDMYVQRKDFKYPLWDAVKKGNLSDQTPFLFPKYNSSGTLVADHTEGVEPSPGSFTMTSQTVTPKPMSGKVEITREVWDMGGNPQVSNLIFNEMVRGWNEALESSVSTELNAQAASITDVTLPLAATNATLVDAVLSAFAGFQYERGGFRYDNFAAQIDLFKALAAASDTAGRKLLPYLNPHNAPGSSGPQLGALDIQGMPVFPAWALAATSVNRTNSWLFDSRAVHGWASVPQRLEWNFGGTVQSGQVPQVALVTLGIWGYRAVAVSDVAGVRQFTYDPQSPES